jgi:hypothetical protein
MNNPMASCAVDVRETGTWNSTVRVNGVEHSDSIVLYCAESEPLLNNDLFRQQLLAALDSSNASSTFPGDQNERTFFLVQDTVTPGAVPHLQIFPRGPNDDACNGTPQVPTPDKVAPNTKILTWGHTHPFDASDPNMGNRLTVCRDKSGRQAAFYGLEGFSPDDRIAGDSFNNPTNNPAAQAAGWLPMPGVIIDLHNVYILRPGDNPGDDLTAANRFSWDGYYPKDPNRLARRCVWPKRIVN